MKRRRVRPAGMAIDCPTKLISRKSGEVCAFSLEERGAAGTFLRLAVSQDFGESFSPRKDILKLDPLAGEWICLEGVQDCAGGFHFFFLNDENSFRDRALLKRGEGERTLAEEYEGLNLNIYHARCADDFSAFSAPRRIWEGYAGSLNSCLALKSGRLLLPFSYVVRPQRVWSRRGEQVSPFSFFGTYNCTALYSDDFGESFSLSNDLWTPSPDIVSAYGAVEPVCFECADGVDMLIRTQLGVFYRAHSADGARFDAPRPTEIISSDSPAGIARVAGRTILMYNSCMRYPYAFGGRHVLHAAVSDDDLNTLRGIREIAADPMNCQPPPPSGDYGTAYPYPCAMKNGEVIFATGQGGGRYTLSLLDPDWLEEREHVADFAWRADEWHHFGTNNITVDAAGARISPSDGPGGAAVWNFPALASGEVTLRIEARGLRGALTLMLTDHFSTPFDDNDVFPSVFRVSPRVEGDIELRLSFSLDQGKIDVFANGEFICREKNRRLPANGVNYLRVKTPVFEDAAGYVLIKAARAEES